jgi:hypothetical protein
MKAVQGCKHDVGVRLFALALRQVALNGRILASMDFVHIAH